MKQYSIGQISKLIGLPEKTIRFYEAEKVISSPQRGENGYRQYSESALEELRMLKYARDLGLPLSEIKKLMRGCDNGDCHHSKEFITESIDSYTAQLSRKINEMKILQLKLQQFKEDINSINQSCEDGPFCCNILHQIVIKNQNGGETHGR